MKSDNDMKGKRKKKKKKNEKEMGKLFNDEGYNN